VSEAPTIEISNPFKFSSAVPDAIDALPDEVMNEVGTVFQRVESLHERCQ